MSIGKFGSIIQHKRTKKYYTVVFNGLCGVGVIEGKYYPTEDDKNYISGTTADLFEHKVNFKFRHLVPTHFLRLKSEQHLFTEKCIGAEYNFKEVTDENEIQKGE